MTDEPVDENDSRTTRLAQASRRKTTGQIPSQVLPAVQSVPWMYHLEQAATEEHHVTWPKNFPANSKLDF